MQIPLLILALVFKICAPLSSFDLSDFILCKNISSQQNTESIIYLLKSSFEDSNSPTLCSAQFPIPCGAMFLFIDFSTDYTLSFFGLYISMAPSILFADPVVSTRNLLRTRIRSLLKLKPANIYLVHTDQLAVSTKEEINNQIKTSPNSALIPGILSSILYKQFSEKTFKQSIRIYPLNVSQFIPCTEHSKLHTKQSGRADYGFSFHYTIEDNDSGLLSSLLNNKLIIFINFTVDFMSDKCNVYDINIKSVRMLPKVRSYWYKIISKRLITYSNKIQEKLFEMIKDIHKSSPLGNLKLPEETQTYTLHTKDDVLDGVLDMETEIASKNSFDTPSHSLHEGNKTYEPPGTLNVALQCVEEHTGGSKHENRTNKRKFDNINNPDNSYKQIKGESKEQDNEPITYINGKYYRVIG